MKNTKKIAYLGVGIALYVVLGFAMKIPIIGHIQTDLGYIAFGVFCFLFGPIAAVVGVIGCLFESLLINGWVPIGWMIGQAFIGITCGFAYKINREFNFANIIVTVFLAMFFGIGIIKTGFECVLYDIPVLVKLPKNLLATIADSIPMVFGLYLGTIFEKRNIIK